MKKIYTTLVIAALVLTAGAQSINKAVAPYASKAHVKTTGGPRVIHPNTQAVGDTVFVFDGFYFYDWNNTLPANFKDSLEDIDGFTINSSMQPYYGTSGSFNFFYEIDPGSTLHYSHADSVFYASGCSWFQPAGQADNWLEMGPVHVPSTGGHLQWRHNVPDPNYRDGYQVLVNTTGLGFANFTNAPIFSVADMDPSTVGDTVFFASPPVFYQRMADLPGMAGQDIYIAFHHNANDQFIVCLNDLILIEGPLGENEKNADVAVIDNWPNPANEMTNIRYNLKNASEVTLSVFDVAGKQVLSSDEGRQLEGKHNIKLEVSSLPAGMYYYTLKANESQITKKLIITR